MIIYTQELLQAMVFERAVLYRLLGEVQVYETRECMLEAHRCIKYGVVSLDGGILREKGVISLGYGSLSL